MEEFIQGFIIQIRWLSTNENQSYFYYGDSNKKRDKLIWLKENISQAKVIAIYNVKLKQNVTDNYLLSI